VCYQSLHWSVAFFKNRNEISKRAQKPEAISPNARSDGGVNKYLSLLRSHLPDIIRFELSRILLKCYLSCMWTMG
jgi:hypothetical protein